MLKRRFRHLSPFGLSFLALAVAAIASPADAQTYPSSMIRIVVAERRRHAAGHHGPHHCGRARRERRLARHRREQARRDPDDRACRGAQAAGGRLYARLDRLAGLGRARASAQCQISARRRLCAGHQACIGIPRAGRPSLGSGQVAGRIRRAAQEPAGQADVFLRRLRHAGASRGRNVQAADRRARHPCALSGAAARDRRPDQRHEPVPVHHAAAGARPDRHRQIARDRRHRAGAAAGPEGRADRRRGGFPRPDHSGLVRHSGEDRNTE